MKHEPSADNRSRIQMENESNREAGPESSNLQTNVEMSEQEYDPIVEGNGRKRRHHKIIKSESSETETEQEIKEEEDDDDYYV